MEPLTRFAPFLLPLIAAAGGLLLAAFGARSLMIWPLKAVKTCVRGLLNRPPVIRKKIPKALIASLFSILSLGPVILAINSDSDLKRTFVFATLALAGALNIYTLRSWENASIPPRKRRAEPGDFYRGTEWRRLRYRVLRKNRACALCGSRQRPLHVDHIKPRSKYPSLAYDIENLQVLCADCNIGKSNKYEDDFR